MLRDLAQDVRTDEYNPKWIEDEPHTAVLDNNTTAPEYGGGPNAYFQLEESPFRSGIEGAVFILKYAIGGAELTEVVGKAEPGPGEFYVDYKEAGRKGTGRVEVNVTDAGKDFLVSYYGVGAVGSVANMTTLAEETAAAVVSSEVATQLPGALSAYFTPGLTTQFIRGRRRSASPSFPWHPYSETRIFSQSEAPDFFSEVYNDYFEVDGQDSLLIGFVSGGTGAEHRRAFTLESSNPTNDALFALFKTQIDIMAANRGYDFGLKGTFTGALSGTLNSSTDIFSFASAHNLKTGHAVKSSIAASGGISTGYVRVLTSTTFSLHPTEADAEANTNMIDFTTGGAVTVSRDYPNIEMIVGLFDDNDDLVANLWLTGLTLSAPPVVSAYSIAGQTMPTTGSVSGWKIRFYRNRVVDSTTTVKWHAIEDSALMSMRSDGSLANGLERLDAMQGHRHNIGPADNGGNTGVTVVANAPGFGMGAGDANPVILYVGNARSDGINGEPRTGPITRPRSVIVEPYVYVGANTLS